MVATESARKSVENMEWYVLNHDFNANKVESFNIFGNSKFINYVAEALTNFITYDDFKEQIRKNLMYCFWSKTEYEIAVGGLLSKYPEDFEKIDVYSQVLPNLDTLCHYIIDTYNAEPKRKKQINV